MAENPLTKLPLAGQAAVGLLAAGLIGFLFYQFYWTGAEAERATKAKELETLRAEIKQLEVTAARREEFEKELATLDARLQVMQKYLPAQKETPQIMRAIQLLAYGSSLSVRRFTPAATVQKDFYLEAPISVDLDGSYHNIARFFDSVSRLPRLVNIGNLKMKASGKQTETNSVTASVVATTYVYQEAPPKPAGKGKGGKR